MTLADLIKKGSLRGFATATPATFATPPVLVSPCVATVATVAVAKVNKPAANGLGPTESPPWRVTFSDGITPETVAKFRAASLALDELQATYPEADLNPDRWCWPASDAMNTLEIDTFMARLLQFTNSGISLVDSESVADTLVKRDRDPIDVRRVCLECKHLNGRGGSWRCNQWRQAGLGASGLPADLVTQLQHCGGFTAVKAIGIAFMRNNQ